MSTRKSGKALDWGWRGGRARLRATRALQRWLGQKWALLGGRSRLQGIVIALVVAVGLELFLRAIAVITNVSSDGWVVCWRLNGIIVALMLMIRRRRWGWLLAGFVLEQIFYGLRFAETWAEIWMAIGCNLLEIAITAFTLPKFRNLDQWLREPNLIWRFTGYGLLLAPIAGAIPAAYYFRQLWKESFWTSMCLWTLGDSLGMVLWLPMVLVVASRRAWALFAPRKLLQTLGMIALLVANSGVLFLGVKSEFSFVLFPILLWIVLRLGFSGSVIAVNLLALIATTGTLNGNGAFAYGGSLVMRILALQVFLMLTMLMSFPLSVVLLERERFERELGAAYRKMERLATHDGLTGVANRRRFDEALQQEWRRAQRERQPLALLMVDADHFKSYNDRYGHLAGDEVLKYVSQRLAAGVQRPTDLAARYGGEEFVMLLPGTDEDGARMVGELIRWMVEEQRIAHEGSRMGVVTVSVGCCSMIPGEDATNDWRFLLKCADEALYRAKANGRNRVECFLQEDSIQSV